jgi:hypothetical protein
LDEAGCTGADLPNTNQPIFVLGGISVRDEGWNHTHLKYVEILSSYFYGTMPRDFELHSCDLLSPNGEGVFAGHPRESRNNLAIELLELIATRRHEIHAIAINKQRLLREPDISLTEYNPKVPYLLAYDFLVGHIEHLIKTRLGRSARAMVILDSKDQFATEIETITRARRFTSSASSRIKRIVEFSYPIDSTKNPMIQLSDLVVFCIKRFLEFDLGLRAMPPAAARFYAECYQRMDKRIIRKSIVKRSGTTYADLNRLFKRVHSRPSLRWRQKFFDSNPIECRDDVQ